MLKVGEFRTVDRSMGGLVVAMMLASGCVTEEGVASSEAPIAELSLASGLTVSFYEPRPGRITIAEDMPAGVQPPDDAHLTAVELYAHLAPGQAIPEALLAAQARVNAARAARPRPPRTESSVVAPTTQSFIENNKVDDEWFVNNHCDGNYDQNVCRINQTEHIFSSRSDIDFAKYCACTDVGVVTLRMQAEDDPIKTKDLFEDHCWCFWDDSGSVNDAVWGDVVNVGGNDRYHFSARYNF